VLRRGNSVESHLPAFVFDLDGTLVDSVYQHVLAWQRALRSIGAEISVWRIHRKIGMSGGLAADIFLRELGHDLSDTTIERLIAAHGEAFAAMADQVRPLPGSTELIAELDARGVSWAIATSGVRRTAQAALDMLGLDEDAVVITRDMVKRAKPDPDLFLAAAAEIGVAPSQCYVVGDSVWDLLAAQRAGSLGIGLLSGGYGRDELERAGAYRVFDDPAELLTSLGELGVRRTASNEH
jgi:HAD superfamily hydrolase (TIGR01509 family)